LHREGAGVVLIEIDSRDPGVGHEELVEGLAVLDDESRRPEARTPDRLQARADAERPLVRAPAAIRERGERRARKHERDRTLAVDRRHRLRRLLLRREQSSVDRDRNVGLGARDRRNCQETHDEENTDDESAHVYYSLTHDCVELTLKQLLYALREPSPR